MKRKIRKHLVKKPMQSTLRINGETTPFIYRCTAAGESFTLNEWMKRLSLGEDGKRVIALTPKVTPIEDGNLAKYAEELKYGKILYNLIRNQAYIIETYSTAVVKNGKDHISEAAMLSGLVKVHEMTDTSSGEDQNTMAELYVKDMCGNTMHIKIDITVPVENLMLAISKKTSQPLDAFYLVHDNTHLGAVKNHALMDVGIKDKTTISLVHRLRGGMMHASSARSDFERLGDDLPARSVKVMLPGMEEEHVTVLLTGRDTKETLIQKARKAIHS